MGRSQGEFKEIKYKGIVKTGSTNGTRNNTPAARSWRGGDVIVSVNGLEMGAAKLVQARMKSDFIVAGTSRIGLLPPGPHRKNSGKR